LAGCLRGALTGLRNGINGLRDVIFYVFFLYFLIFSRIALTHLFQNSDRNMEKNKETPKAPVAKPSSEHSTSSHSTSLSPAATSTKTAATASADSTSSDGDEKERHLISLILEMSDLPLTPATSHLVRSFLLNKQMSVDEIIVQLGKLKIVESSLFFD
jgi:hypothetical protein